jgi:hypothetical protein
MFLIFFSLASKIYNFSDSHWSAMKNQNATQQISSTTRSLPHLIILDDALILIFHQIFMQVQINRAILAQCIELALMHGSLTIGAAASRSTSKR